MFQCRSQARERTSPPRQSTNPCLHCWPFQVPITLYFMTHAYFCFYHTLSNLLIRRVRHALRGQGALAQVCGRGCALGGRGHGQEAAGESVIGILTCMHARQLQDLLHDLSSAQQRAQHAPNTGSVGLFTIAFAGCG